MCTHLSFKLLPSVSLHECVAAQALIFNAKVNNLAMTLITKCFQRANQVIKSTNSFFFPRCPAACGILLVVPQPGTKPVPPAVEAGSPNH